MLLWMHFICGEASLGLYINNMFYFLCAVRRPGSSLRGGWEHDECVKDLWENRKETTKEQMWRAFGRAGFRRIRALCLHL